MTNLKNKFAERKNVTKQAMTDLETIMDYITNIVDDINVIPKATINFRASRYNNYGSMVHYSNELSNTLKLAVINGRCSLYVGIAYNGTIVDQFDALEFDTFSFFDYINLADVQDVIDDLFDDLDKIGTRSEIGDYINALVKKAGK